MVSKKFLGAFTVTTERNVGLSVQTVQGDTFSKAIFHDLRSPGVFAKWPIIGLTMFLLGGLTFSALAYYVTTNQAFLQWDLMVSNAFRAAQISAPWPLMENVLFGIFLGKEMAIVVGTILAIYFFHKRFWRELTMVVLSLGGGGLIWYLLSRYFDRPRPANHLDVLLLPGPSFPSGSALMGVAFYGLLAYLLIPNISSRFWKWFVAFLCVLVIAMITLSSPLFGTHYVSDVIAGSGLGLAWAGLVYTLVEKFSGGATVGGQKSSRGRHASQGLRSPGWFKRWPIIGITMVLLGSLSFAALAYNLLAHGPLIQLDMFLYKQLLAQSKAASSDVNDIMLFGFFVGKQAVEVIVAVLSIYFIYKRYWREFAMINLSSAGGGLLWNFLIGYFSRPRPPEQTGLVIKSIPTFPSGHATGVAICFGFLAYLLIPRMPSLFWKWTLGIAILLLVLFDGFSRIFQGNHYMTDVLAGYALAIAWLGFVCTLIEGIFMRKKT